MSGIYFVSYSFQYWKTINQRFINRDFVQEFSSVTAKSMKVLT